MLTARLGTTKGIKLITILKSFGDIRKSIHNISGLPPLGAMPPKKKKKTTRKNNQTKLDNILTKELRETSILFYLVR